MKSGMKRVLVAATVVALLATLCGTLSVSAAEPDYTTGAEILVNGDFEQGALRWAVDDNSPGKEWIRDGVGKDGGVGMRLCEVVADENNEKVQFYQGLIEVTPGNCYVLSFDYLAVPGNTFYVRSGNLGCGKNTVKLGDSADGTWKTFTKVFTVPSTYVPKEHKGLGVYITKVGEKPAIVDNLSIKECTLNAKPESVVLDYGEITLLKGRTQTLKALTDPVKSDVNNTVWASSDETVATVSMGKVTAVGGGTATVTVTMNNGKSASCEVTVVDKEPTKADLTVNSLTWTGGDGEVKPGTKLTFTTSITNVGTEDVTEPFDVDISAGQDRLMRLTYNKGIKAGETVEITAEPWAAVAGDHMMAVRVNPTLKVAESNDVTNNAYQINLRVAEDRLVPAYNADLVTEAGFTNLTFNEDFDSLDTVDKAASGKEGYKWYVTRPYGASTLTPDDYSIKDGIMSLHLEVPTYNYGLSTVDIPTWNGYTFNKGYMEYRVRMPHYDGSLSGGPAIWSMPENKLHNKDVEMWIEVDWMEYWGTKSKEEGYYTITLHEQWVDEKINVTDWYSNGGHRSKSGFGDAEWHTMGFLWEENRLRAFFDGRQVLEQTYGKGEVPIPLNTTEQGEFRVDDVFSYMNEQIVPVFISGSKGNPMEIDYIRVWQLGDGESEKSPETGAATALPTIGAVLVTAAAGMWVSRKRR